MSLIVQNDDGTVENANAYIDVAFFKSYHDLRGNDYPDDDSEIESAIIRGTDYVDIRYKYSGYKTNSRQSTQFPRMGRPIGKYVKEATAEYAIRALDFDIAPDPDIDVGGKIKMKDYGLGPLKDKVEYFEHADEYQYELPVYPIADRKLRLSGFVSSLSVGVITR